MYASSVNAVDRERHTLHAYRRGVYMLLKQLFLNW